MVANILMLSILVGGAWTAFHVRKESFPSFEAESVNVEVPFRGGVPEDVERGVTIRIEDSLQGVRDLIEREPDVLALVGRHQIPRRERSHDDEEHAGRVLDRVDDRDES